MPEKNQFPKVLVLHIGEMNAPMITKKILSQSAPRQTVSQLLSTHFQGWKTPQHTGHQLISELEKILGNENFPAAQAHLFVQLIKWKMLGDITLDSALISRFAASLESGLKTDICTLFGTTSLTETTQMTGVEQVVKSLGLAAGKPEKAQRSGDGPSSEEILKGATIYRARTPGEINKIPDDAVVLYLIFADVSGVEFSRFKSLKKISLYSTKNITYRQIRQLPPTLIILELPNMSVKGVNFSRFSQLEEIDLTCTSNLTRRQIQYLPGSLRKLCLSAPDVKGVNFSRFSHLEEIDLACTKNLAPRQIQCLPGSLSKLGLHEVNVFRFDFTHFTHLEEIDLCDAENLAPRQIQSLPCSLRKLNLVGADVDEFKFTHLTELEEINLIRAENLTPDQIQCLEKNNPGIKILR